MMASVTGVSGALSLGTGRSKPMMAEPTPVSLQESHVPWSLSWQGPGPQGGRQLCLFTAIITARVPPGLRPGTRAPQCLLLSLLLHLVLPPPPPPPSPLLPPLGHVINEGYGRIRDGCGSTLNLCLPAYLCGWQPLWSPLNQVLGSIPEMAVYPL